MSVMLVPPHCANVRPFPWFRLAGRGRYGHSHDDFVTKEHLLTLAIILAYVIGATAGFAIARTGKFATEWRVFIRTQLLLSSALISLLAGWQLGGWSDLLWPVLVTAVCVLLIGIAYFLTPASPSRPAHAVLGGWSAIPNPGFWLVPMSDAIAGGPGVIVAVFIDRLARAVFGVFVWILRRHAPIRQRKRTSFIDEAPFIALIAGLVLNYFSDAPEWTWTVINFAAPVLAATGAAVFIGSVMHPSQQIAWRPGVRVWVILTAVRIALMVPMVLLAPTPAIAVVLALGAFSIPAFFPPQFSVLYGYADSVVAASVRLAWFLAPIGVVWALLIMRV